jgi:hypothetical protein
MEYLFINPQDFETDNYNMFYCYVSLFRNIHQDQVFLKDYQFHAGQNVPVQSPAQLQSDCFLFVPTIHLITYFKKIHEELSNTRKFIILCSSQRN